MRGIPLDALFIVIAIILVALVFYRFWVPPLMRFCRDIREDVDKTNRSL